MSRRIIDCEHHFYGNCLVDYLKNRKGYPCYDEEHGILKMAENRQFHLT